MFPLLIPRPIPVPLPKLKPPPIPAPRLPPLKLLEFYALSKIERLVGFILNGDEVIGVAGATAAIGGSFELDLNYGVSFLLLDDSSDF